MPASFLIHWAGDQTHAAGRIAEGLLRQILRGDVDWQNLDLDADRGFGHLCWDVAAGSSIDDPVINVDVISYGTE